MERHCRPLLRRQGRRPHHRPPSNEVQASASTLPRVGRTGRVRLESGNRVLREVQVANHQCQGMSPLIHINNAAITEYHANKAKQMLEHGVSERWPSRHCEQKWRELSSMAAVVNSTTMSMPQYSSPLETPMAYVGMPFQ